MTPSPHDWARARLALERHRGRRKPSPMDQAKARLALHKRSQANPEPPEESWGDWAAQMLGDVALGSLPAALTFAVTSPLGPWVSIPAAGAVGAVAGGIGGRAIDAMIGEDEAKPAFDETEMAYDALFGGGLGLAGKAAGAGLRKFWKGRGATGSSFINWLEDKKPVAETVEQLKASDPHVRLDDVMTSDQTARRARLDAMDKSRYGRTHTAKEIKAGNARRVAERRILDDDKAQAAWKEARGDRKVNEYPDLKSATGDGRPVAARTFGDEIYLDSAEIDRTFRERAWRDPKVEGVHPLADDLIKTRDDWASFLELHEHSHFDPTVSSMAKGAARENAANERAAGLLREMGGRLSPEKREMYAGVIKRAEPLERKYRELASKILGQSEHDEVSKSLRGMEWFQEFAYKLQRNLGHFKRPHAFFRSQPRTTKRPGPDPAGKREDMWVDQQSPKLVSKVLESMGIDSVAVEQTYNRLSNRIGTHGSKAFQNKFYFYATGKGDMSVLTDVDKELLGNYHSLQMEISDLAEAENILTLHSGTGEDALFKNFGDSTGLLEVFQPKWEGGVRGQYAMQAIDPQKAKARGMSMSDLEQKYPGSSKPHQSRGRSHFFGRVQDAPEDLLVHDYKQLLQRQRVMHAHTLSQGLNWGGYASDAMTQVTAKGQQTYVHGWLKAALEATKRDELVDQSQMLKRVMSDIYDAEHDQPLRSAVHTIKDAASNVYLVRNFIPQMTEAMNVFGFAKVSDLTEGRAYHKKYGLKEKWSRTMGSVTDQIAEVLSEDEKHHAAALMARKADRAARVFGIEPLTGKLLAQSKVARSKTSRPSATELWEAAEAFPLEVNDMDAWKKIQQIGDGSTEEAQELMREGVDNLIRRQMHLFTTGSTPSVMRNPASSMVLQFRTFQLNAAGRFYEDIIGPMRYGNELWKRGKDAADEAMIQEGRDLWRLGAKRFGRASALGMAPQTAGRALRTIMDKNTEGWDEEDWVRYLAAQGARDTVTMQAGVYGDMVNIFGMALLGDSRSMDQFLGAIPGANLMGDTVGRMAVGAGQVYRGDYQAGMNQVMKGGLNIARMLFPFSAAAVLAPSPTGGLVKGTENAVADFIR